MLNVKFLKYFALFELVLFVDIAQPDEDYEDGIPINPDDLDVSTSYQYYRRPSRYNDDFSIESVLGSYVESDDFLDFEPEEIKETLDIFFESMDLNKNGSISRTELSQWILQSFQKKDAKNSVKKFVELDENHDLSISLNEFLNKSYGHTKKEIEIMSKKEEWKIFINQISSEVQRFHLSDRNQNGILDFHEFIRFNNPENYEEMSSYGLNRTLALFDKNKDDFVDLDEFLGEYVLDNDTENNERKAFTVYDANSDGVLNKEEIRIWSTPGFSKLVEFEVEHLFNKTDTNRDNQLIKEEVINQHELWVGSQATDYGIELEDIRIRDEL